MKRLLYVVVVILLSSLVVTAGSFWTKAKQKKAEIVDETGKVISEVDDTITSVETRADTVIEQYEAAKAAVEAAKKDGNYTELKNALLKKADLAGKLGLVGVEIWQYNNVGYYTIEEFKDQTGYNALMADIAKEVDTTKKAALVREAKEKFEKHQEWLVEAKSKLERAQTLQKSMPQKDEDYDVREAKINSNLGYILWVLDYIEK